MQITLWCALCCSSSISRPLPDSADEAFQSTCSEISVKFGERMTNESIGKTEVDGKVKYTQKKRKKSGNDI
jgi:hypothetical protein